MGGGGLPTHRDQRGIASFLPGLPQALCLPTTSPFLPLARPSWPSSSPGSSSLEQQKSVLFTWLRSLEPVLQGFHRTVRRLHLGEKVGDTHVKIPAMPKLKQNKIATTNPQHYRNAQEQHDLQYVTQTISPKSAHKLPSITPHAAVTRERMSESWQC